MNEYLKEKLCKLRQEISYGNTEHLFADEYFDVDFIKALYEEYVDPSIKMDLLVLLESYAVTGGLNPNSIDQTTIALMDIFIQSWRQANSNTEFLEQVLYTICTLGIQFELQTSEIFDRYCNTLVSVATADLNAIENRRLRGCAVQCLIQLEEYHHGILWKHRDIILRAMRKEMTDIHEQYCHLVIKIIYGAFSNHNGQSIGSDNNEHKLERQLSLETQEVRQVVSMIMDQVALLSPCVIWHISLMLSHIVQQHLDISAMMFKPFMLHQMASQNMVIIHLILHLQREFEKEILTEAEEAELLHRLLKLLGHPSLTPVHRLFVAHWLSSYSEKFEEDEGLVSLTNSSTIFKSLYPSVFDPPECQFARIGLLNSSFKPMVTECHASTAALLLASVGCLHKLVWHTGSSRLAVFLFRALFYMYRRHCSRSFSQDINRFLRGLISGFPYFIPHCLDFIECLRETTPDSPVYLEILGLLHQQIVSQSDEQNRSYFHFYLLVLKSSSLQQHISPVETVKFLHYLSQNSLQIDSGSWSLGNDILTVCQNLLLCHGSSSLYGELGDLLFQMMTDYRDIDVRDKAGFLFSVLTMTTDDKIKSLLQTCSGQAFQLNLSNLVPAANSKVKKLGRIIEQTTPSLVWQRKKTHGEVTADEDGTISEQNLLRQTEEEESEGVKCHKQQLQNGILKLLYQVSFSEEANSETCTAIIIHITTPEFVTCSKDLYIPRLIASETVNVEVTLIPSKPLSCVCSASIEFCQNGCTYHSDLESIDVEFSDYLLPLDTVKLPLEKSKWFENMWQEFIVNAKSDSSMETIQSLKMVNLNWSVFRTKSLQNLKQFLVEEESPDQLLFGMIVLPQHYLMLKCQPVSNRVKIEISLDFPEMLPDVEQFLNTVSS